MTVANPEIEYARGDSFPTKFQLKDSGTGAVIDITGFTFRLTVNTTKNPVDTTDQVFTVNGTIEDAANGLVSFAPSESDTDLVPGVYFYDMELIDTSGRKRTFAKGVFRIFQDISKG